MEDDPLAPVIRGLLAERYAASNWWNTRASRHMRRYDVDQIAEANGDTPDVTTARLRALVEESRPDEKGC